jgi:hypothetical protein
MVYGYLGCHLLAKHAVASRVWFHSKRLIECWVKRPKNEALRPHPTLATTAAQGEKPAGEAGDVLSTAKFTTVVVGGRKTWADKEKLGIYLSIYLPIYLCCPAIGGGFQQAAAELQSLPSKPYLRSSIGGTSQPFSPILPQSHFSSYSIYHLDCKQNEGTIRKLLYYQCNQIVTSSPSATTAAAKQSQPQGDTHKWATKKKDLLWSLAGWGLLLPSPKQFAGFLDNK